MSTATVRVRDLVIEYDSDGYAVRPIDGLDLDAAPGELVVLLGPSGCGKTSLLSVLGGILRPTAGTVQVGGGQQQRVAVGRGLAADPLVLLADEPTANLDYIQAEGIISLLRDLRSDGRSIVVSSHDDRLVPIADRVIHLVPEFREDDRPPHAVEFRAGKTIFEQGARGELVYVIDAGTVDIVRRKSDGGLEAVASLGAGDYFGELGPLLGFPRSATALAGTDVRLTAYSVRDFREQVLDGARGHATESISTNGS